MSDATASDPIPQTVPTDAALFREEAARARRYSAAMRDKKVVDQLYRDLYEEHLAMPDRSFAKAA